MGHVGRVARVFATLAWPAAAIVSVGLMLANRQTTDRQLAELRHRRDSLVQQVNKHNAALLEKLTAGDSLPNVSVTDASGRLFNTRMLARQGVRYWYFYRNDCPACEILRPAWMADDAVRNGSLIRVAFDPSVDEEPDTGPGMYGWQHDSLTRQRRLIEYVPALLVVDDGGVVTSAAYGLPQVAKMGFYLNLLDREVLNATAEAFRANLSQSASR